MIETLPILTPDAGRSKRTRARCHERLARRRARAERSAKRASVRYLAVERALVGGLCMMYLSAVALTAIRILSGG
jgi:hypothetical protein